MTQLSRKQKYQELRDRLDEETTAAQAQPVKPVSYTHLTLWIKFKRVGIL